MAAAETPSRPLYVVVTPAHNEAQTLPRLIGCLTAQTARPGRWIVVDDASTDRTAEIVLEAQGRFPWIGLLSRQRDGERHFGGKAQGFNAGVDAALDVPYSYIANLDADVTFPPDYFAYLLGCLENDPRLGVVGTPFREDGFRGYDYRFTNPEHVSGACQLFRRACLDEIGGYQSIPTGGIDWVASTTARMLGWKTLTCRDRVLVHHRPLGTGNRHWGNLHLRQGRKDYMLGNGLGWETLRCFYQVRNRPFFVGAVLMMAGFLPCAIARPPRPISDRLRKFVHDEHAARLRELTRRILRER
jgi:glycosyltransferase involved in cell wall biosynthesis